MKPKYLETIDRYLLYFLIFAFPLIFFPIFPNPYTTPKLAFLVFIISISLILKAVRSIKTGTLSISIGKFDLPIILIAVSFLLSTYLQTPNKAESFFLPGEVTFLIAGIILYFALNQLNEKAKDNLKLILLLSASLYSISIIASQAGLGKLIPQLPSYAKDANFNLAGSLIATLFLLVPPVPFAIKILKKDSFFPKIISGVALSLSALALAITILNILPGKPNSPLIPSVQSSWIVAVETLKTSPLLGVGPGNYITAFNLFRPVTYNQTPLWQTRFNSASNFYLTVLTETGIVGFGSLLILSFAVFRLIKSGSQEKTFNTNLLDKLPVALILILLLLFPYHEVAIVLLFVLASLATKVHKLNLSTVALNYGNIDSNSDKRTNFVKLIPTLCVTIPLIIITLLINFSLISSLKAEKTYKKAIDAVSQNDGKKAYDNLISAINTNPFVDRYHLTYAQINLALANSISQNPNLTDSDKNTVTQLINQAVTEGKAGVSLNPQRSGNWEVLANIYKSIISVAKDADKFTIQTYSQAVALDPVNPNLRIALGSVYYSLKDYDDAIDSLKLAVISKPDFANAHYNLSLAYKAKGDINLAISEMNSTLNLVQKDSQDYQVAQKALDELKKDKPVETSKSENLTTPEVAKTNPLQKQIDLSKEATPPASPKLPGASPTPSPIPSPSTNQ
ncbi:MAG: tetratricopeptide repeat protein [Candidatus Woesebacteria bacterium]|nr:MAG: tetratricopeptide repeat protein [Candidatus Woesebacteria bacterium]